MPEQEQSTIKCCFVPFCYCSWVNPGICGFGMLDKVFLKVWQVIMGGQLPPPSNGRPLFAAHPSPKLSPDRKLPNPPN